MDKIAILAVAAMIFGFAACGTTVNMHGPYPNLQTVNLGQPGCVKDCTTTHTATQSVGPGDVQGANVSTTRSGNSGHNLGVPQ